MGESKVKAIRDSPVPILILQVRSFHHLALFDRRFMRNLSSLMAPVAEVLKGKKFKWNGQAQKAFEAIKEKLINAHPSSTKIFKVFEVECDASGWAWELC